MPAPSKGVQPPALPHPADATRPPELPRLELSLVVENDNKLGGTWQAFGTDGNDLGRTHGVRLTVGRPVRPGLRWDVEFGSEIFTTQLWSPTGVRLNLDAAGNPHAHYSKHRNLYFNELSWVLGRARGLFAADPRFSYLFGGGLIVSNRSGVSPGGASLQQALFHRFLDRFDENTREYRYLESGPVRLGALVEVGARVLGRFAERRGFRVRSFAELATQFNSLAHGTHVRALARSGLDLGRRRHFDLPVAELALTQEVRVYAESRATMFDTQVDFFVHARRVDLIVTFDAYYGDPHNLYYGYNFSNTTTTLGLGFRLP